MKSISRNIEFRFGYIVKTFYFGVVEMRFLSLIFLRLLDYEIVFFCWIEMLIFYLLRRIILLRVFLNILESGV